ncbi:MAG TPA: alpha/beta hydrolase [Thermoanaerobaculia bacterium]|nr:alpha/beta hydrolase [Thermoanaerobaculia bacterium]
MNHSREVVREPADLRRAPRPPQAPPLVDKKLRSVRLFYGTNRARIEGCEGVSTVSRRTASGRCRTSAYYGGVMLPSPEEGTAGLEVGTLAVTFPPIHGKGKIERPLEVFSFRLRGEDPDQHVVISELRSFGSDFAAWARELRATGRDQAFIYVHGFEHTFEKAALRAAQIAYDLDFDVEEDFRGVPMLFSWPSRGGIDAYGVDYDVSFESIDAFNRFLDLVKHEAGIRQVHVIAHSMGNRVVTEALLARAERQQVGPLVDQLVLAAPDVWASRFKNKFLRTLPRLAARVTLYVSNQDRALIASSKIRKDEPRAGQVEGGLLEASRGVERFDAINASTLETDFLGHGYYASHGSMLGDIYCLLKGTPAAGRPLLLLAGPAWQFRPPVELAALAAGACRAAAPAPPAAIPIPEPAAFPWLPVWVLLGAALVVLVIWRLRRGR